MKNLLFSIGSLIIVTVGNAQSWTLKDTGVGLIVEDGNNNKPLKIIQRNTIWDIKYLYENGALEGKFNGNQLFAAWIQGPETKEFLNGSGIPVWMVKYSITYPNGKIYESAPIDFYTSGFSFLKLKFESQTEGVWRIDWFIYNRTTQLSRKVATSLFETIWGKPEQ
jgi:hypothetical protein